MINFWNIHNSEKVEGRVEKGEAISKEFKNQIQALGDDELPRLSFSPESVVFTSDLGVGSAQIHHTHNLVYDAITSIVRHSQDTVTSQGIHETFLEVLKGFSMAMISRADFHALKGFDKITTFESFIRSQAELPSNTGPSRSGQ